MLPLQSAVGLYLGAKERVQAVKDLPDMTEEERHQLYEEACAAVGIPIDPEVFTK